MSQIREITEDDPKGILRKGWSSATEDYAIVGGWARKGKVLMVGDTVGGLYAFEGTSGRLLWEKHRLHNRSLLSMAIHPAGDLLVTGGQDGHILVWNVQEGQVTKTIELGRGWVEHMSWSPDGQKLIVSMSKTVVVYNQDFKEIWKFEHHRSTVSAVAWSGNQEVATACYGQVTFLDAVAGTINQRLEWQGSMVSMVLSPDGDVVACGSQDNSVHFWRRSTGQDSMMQGYPTKPTNLAFDHTGTLLATGGSDTVLVWSFAGDGPEGTTPGELTFHIKPITALTFATGRRRLASGARDGAVLVWSLQSDGDGGVSGAALVKEPVSELLWRPDGRALAALDAGGGVTVWRVRD